MKIGMVQRTVKDTKQIVPTIYEVTNQNRIVHLNVPFFNSPRAVAHAAKHGIVVILNIINANKAGKVAPVFSIKTPTEPISLIKSGSALEITAAKTANNPTIFSFAIKPAILADTNTHPNPLSCEPKPRGVNNGCTIFDKTASMDSFIIASSK